MRYLGLSVIFAGIIMASGLNAVVGHWGGEAGVTTNYNGTPYYEGGDYNPDYYSNPNSTIYYYSPDGYEYNNGPNWDLYGGYGGYGGWGGDWNHGDWNHHHGDWNHDHHDGDHHNGEHHHEGEHHGGEHHSGGHHGGGGHRR